MAVRYTPANQLGGDVYDFYRLDNNRLGILVADVSGHGVNSAMLSGMVKALAAPLSIAVLEPGELLAGLDVAGEQYFPEGYFCTGFYLIADEETGLVRYAGVGHPPAMIVGPNGPRILQSNPGMLGIGMVDGTAGDTDRLEAGRVAGDLHRRFDRCHGSVGRALRRGAAEDVAPVASWRRSRPRSSTRSRTHSTSTRHRDARPTISTSSFSSVSPSNCSPSGPRHVKLVWMVRTHLLGDSARH